MKRRGFTIVELLVVVAIIGVLMSIVSVAANGAIRSSRTKRANAMCAVMQQAIAAYYAKVGEWPDEIEKRSKNMGDEETYVFSATETDNIFREIVKASVGANATMQLLDASGLFVARTANLKGSNREGCYDNHAQRRASTTYCGDQNCVNGVDFSQAVKRGKGHISVNEMSFGFQGTEYGKFCRFWVTYNGRTDSVTVTRQRPGYNYPEGWK